jgi:hypothetical protein
MILQAWNPCSFLDFKRPVLFCGKILSLSRCHAEIPLETLVPSQRNPCNYCGINIYSVAGSKSCLQVKKPFPQAPLSFQQKGRKVLVHVIKSLIASTSAKCGNLNSGCTHLTWPERIYNSHYGNGVPAMFTS